MKTRIEKDSLGVMEVPVDAYYGIHTARAMENFSISGLRAEPSFVTATTQVKRAATMVNRSLGVLGKNIADAIIQACDEIVEGRLREHFVVDVFQAGAGTSHNMNANEVIANRAIEIMGGRKGDYSIVHPNDHVNLSQSTNDVFPTAMRLASISMLKELLPTLNQLEQALRAKGEEFNPIVKAGRTHLQDATPIRLGQEFMGYSVCIRKNKERIERASEGLYELGIGGTAVGTGMNSHPLYRGMVVEELRKETGLDLRGCDDLRESMQSMTPFVSLSGALKGISLDLIRIANDLRLLSSGPMTGLREIELPAVQAGSSIMPGKVNPSMAEMLDMVCFQVTGNDLTISMASQAGQLELNVMMPVISHNLLQSLKILNNGVSAFTEKCVRGIKADRDRCGEFAEKSLGIVTALTPYIGYEASARVAQEALASRRSIKEMAMERGVLSREELKRVLDVERMTEPREK
ncbi:MAG: aspartate ammonia-lyase [Deltaproteobacteria bacterium GWA2_54_12]|nr:MAG: aspartate ammonia-lyase [Deltaproteobacteria bacterium GWA2_54_12]